MSKSSGGGNSAEMQEANRLGQESLDLQKEMFEFQKEQVRKSEEGKESEEAKEAAAKELKQRLQREGRQALIHTVKKKDATFDIFKARHMTEEELDALSEGKNMPFGKDAAIASKEGSEDLESPVAEEGKKGKFGNFGKSSRDLSDKEKTGLSGETQNSPKVNGNNGDSDTGLKLGNQGETAKNITNEVLGISKRKRAEVKEAVLLQQYQNQKPFERTIKGPKSTRINQLIEHKTVKSNRKDILKRRGTNR